MLRFIYCAANKGMNILRRYSFAKYLLAAVCFLFISLGEPGIYAQEQDQVPVTDTVQVRQHSPKIATLCSAVIPGLGQVYNKKYWKVPVVYAGFGVLAYFIIFNSTHYGDYKNGLKDFTDTIPGTDSYLILAPNLDPSTFDPVLYPDTYNPTTAKWFEDQLENNMGYYSRNRDLTYIISGLWYILNIIDATVDAHLFDYDIGEDLSLHIEPGLKPMVGFNETISLKLTFNF